MRYLFADCGRVFSRIQKSPHIFLFLDYDGTLTSIVSMPEKARLSQKVKMLIKRLQKDPGFTIAIISGRSLKNIKEMVGTKGVIYAGNHGLQIEGRGIRFSKLITKSSIRPTMKKIAASLHNTLREIKGARVEDKGVTLSVHFRLVKRREKDLVKKKINSVTRPYVSAKRVRIGSGKEVMEIRPNLEWDKGKAVTWLVRKKKKALPVYIGDDVTDTDAFRAIKQKGISIFVGRPHKGIGADYFLKNVKEVEKFIERLLQL